MPLAYIDSDIFIRMDYWFTYKGYALYNWTINILWFIYGVPFDI